MVKTRLFINIMIIGLFMTGSALAENRALIIGIGQGYNSYGISRIYGPEQDVKMIKALAYKMGFSDKEIMVMREEKATKVAILKGLNWVKEGVKNGGKTLIYYSGHGFQVRDKNGDEDDGCDEVLVPADGTSEDKFITDDQISDYLKDMDRAEIVFIIDSCFSGTITKNIYVWSDKDTKYLGKGDVRCGEPVNVKSLGMVEGEGTDTKIVVITATAQNEVAFGDITKTGKGSLFTQALYDTIQEKGSNLTFTMLKDDTAKKVRRISEAYNLIPHTPQLNGNPALFDKNIQLAAVNSSYTGRIEDTTDNRELLETVLNNSMFMVAIRADKKRISIGQMITFTVASSKSGYLNLVELEPNGNLNLLFPNKFISKNSINADRQLRIPQDIGGFKLKARAPEGKSMVVAIVSKEPLNLYTEKSVGSGLDVLKVITTGEFASLKSAITRSIEAVAPETKDEKEYGASSIHLEVVK